MKIRRYIGNNTQEAILKVKMDLGNDALILNTRKIRQGGILGFFSRPLIEVLAAVDDTEATKKAKEIVEPNREKKEPEKEKEKEKDSEKEIKINQLETKVNSIESILNKIFEQLNNTPKVQMQNAVTNDNTNAQTVNTKVYQLFSNNLLRSEVDAEITKKLIEAMESKITTDSSVNEVASILFNEINSKLGKPQPIQINETNKPCVVMLVGPTGVGKTTTLAKLAANFVLNEKKKVGLITSDTYRIAAVEQLKTYAQILDTPISVVYSLSEIKDAIQKHGDKDIVLIDTAGKSHKNKKHFEELRTLIEESNPDEIYLLISATTKMRDCKEIVQSYSFLKNYKLLFTKLDETSTFGLILNIREMVDKPLSYVTIGQSVPDDIEVINTEKIAKILLGSIPT